MVDEREAAVVFYNGRLRKVDTDPQIGSSIIHQNPSPPN
jgi:hypothetical protein